MSAWVATGRPNGAWTVWSRRALIGAFTVASARGGSRSYGWAVAVPRRRPRPGGDGHDRSAASPARGPQPPVGCRRPRGLIQTRRAHFELHEARAR